MPPPISPFYLNSNLSSSPLPPPSSSKVQSFHASLPNYKITPLLSLPTLASKLRIKRLVLKDESNRLGLPAFKILGASWGTYKAITTHLKLPSDDSPVRLDEIEERARYAGIALYAATEGNHGRAVSYMADLLGINAYIYVPHDLDEHTKDLIRKQGGEIIESSDYDQAVRDAAEAAERRTEGVGILVQDTAWEGYEDIPRWIVEGYGTMFHEIDEQLEKVDLRPTHVISPVGVGSLAHAVVQYYKSSTPAESPKPNAKVLTVEPITAACLSSNIQLHRNSPAPVPITTHHTICNGMNCGTVSSTAWGDLRNYVDAYLTVEDREVHEGIGLLKELEGLEVGPCSAAGLAGLLKMSEGQRESIGLGEESVVILLGTEGPRPYDVPMREAIKTAD